VIVPRYSARSVWGYYKICRKVGEFADAIAVWVADPEKRYSRVVFGSTAGAPLISQALSSAIAQTGKVPNADAVKKELLQLVPDLDRVKLQMLTVSLQRCVNQALNNE
jgi:carbon-monoxide dehydrogenase medium subunit